jgi:hypothetical protein
MSDHEEICFPRLFPFSDARPLHVGKYLEYLRKFRIGPTTSLSWRGVGSILKTIVIREFVNYATSPDSIRPVRTIVLLEVNVVNSVGKYLRPIKHVVMNGTRATACDDNETHRDWAMVACPAGRRPLVTVEAINQ